jgi:antirestriction protein ArdC
MPSQTEIRDDVTQKIVQALESNLLPWRRPWRATVGGSQPGRHSNVASKRPYQGVNPLLLELHSMRHSFQSKWWSTFPGWKSLGCNVKKRPPEVEEGHWGCRVVFWKPVVKSVVDDQTGDEEDERFFVLRTYTLFNADQICGEAAEGFQVHEDDGQPHAQPDFAPAEQLIASTGADIRHGGERAFYNLTGDYIQLPHRERFDSLGGYYETALHELSHWSEPRQQFDRHQLGYAMCELVAEMAACFTASEIGVPHGETLENHAAYVKSWLEGMKGDRSFIFRASKLANATCDFLLAFAWKPEPEEVGAVQ